MAGVGLDPPRGVAGFKRMTKCGGEGKKKGAIGGTQRCDGKGQILKRRTVSYQRGAISLRTLGKKREKSGARFLLSTPSFCPRRLL